ncbi:hypothetical protein E2C01_049374 [Portunus trituberculatus]|uniref:Uncharacterized protein n=1 Tax=Portunus trituberculatus TaxID=210409 RepID=A0A5B7GCW9_PORTR|nr:hypothetical protein [Portunus trituberculatus]
MMERKDEFRGL